MDISTGNLVTVGGSLYVVYESTHDKIQLVDACYSNCRAMLSWRMIGDIMVATPVIHNDSDDMTDEEFDNVLVEKSRVKFIASSVKDYVMGRTMQSFGELS